MTLLLTAIFGVLIGVSLGALGGGGSILTVPALVYALGESAHAATTGSLVIVGVTAVAGVAAHTRTGHVRWAAGTAFGLAGVAASYAGTALNRHLDPNALLLAFAVLMAVTAAAMLRRTRTYVDAPSEAIPAAAGARANPRPVDSSATAVVALSRIHILTPALVAKVIGAGLVVGFLTGFLGVGGGFVIVPVLVMVLGYPMPVAVGTSLLIIALNSAAALSARIGHDTFHWSMIIPFTLAAIAGSLGGKKIAGRVTQTTLTRSFAGLLIAVAAYVIVRSIAGLT